MKLTEKYSSMITKVIISEESKTQEIIKELVDTSFSGDNNSQMKAVQLLKGLAVSDEPEANAFMKKLDTFTSGMDSKNESDDEEEKEDDKKKKDDEEEEDDEDDKKKKDDDDEDDDDDKEESKNKKKK